MASQHDKLVIVATAADELEGAMLVALLKEQGIRATTTGGLTAQFRAEAPGAIQVLVMQDRLAAARSIIVESVPADSTAGPDVKHLESEAYSPWLTRFGIGTLLIGNLLAIAGIFLYRNSGGTAASSLLAIVVAGALVTSILLRRCWI